MQQAVKGAVAVAAFYKFVRLSEDELNSFMSRMQQYGDLLGIRGLVLFAEEGCNGTVSGSHDAMRAFKAFVTSLDRFNDLTFKDSYCDKLPFRRFSVQRRTEIVTMNNPEIVPNVNPENRLAPEQWDAMLQEGADEVVVLDVRNDYETRLGMFEGAIDPQIRQFSEFPDFVRKSELPRDKKIMMYCTGGIRCEKALEEMQRQGYDRVYQLDGGILRYLEERPRQSFQGECFVFDHRVSVDQDLQPSQQYRLCPHCGNPGTCVIACSKCDTSAVICESCNQDMYRRSCSKNCANHLKRTARQA